LARDQRSGKILDDIVAASKSGGIELGQEVMCRYITKLSYKYSWSL
jgi:hypothetical protein